MSSRRLELNAGVVFAFGNPFPNGAGIQNTFPKGTDYEVETVHALATVKGTEFIVAANENEMEVYCFD